MRSRKLQALDFICRYFAAWGRSPALSEIAAALEISVQRAAELVQALVDDGEIERVAGATRGIRLSTALAQMSEGEVLALLAMRGWTVNDRERTLAPPSEALTESGLPELPLLDHDGAEPGSDTDEASRKRDIPHHRSA